jgi:hypothetical protein
LRFRHYLYAAMPGRSKWDRLRLAYFRAQPWAREPVSALTPATLAGWRILRVTPQQFESGEAGRLVRLALATSGNFRR